MENKVFDFISKYPNGCTMRMLHSEFSDMRYRHLKEIVDYLVMDDRLIMFKESELHYEKLYKVKYNY